MKICNVESFANVFDRKRMRGGEFEEEGGRGMNYRSPDSPDETRKHKHFRFGQIFCEFVLFKRFELAFPAAARPAAWLYQIHICQFTISFYEVTR